MIGAHELRGSRHRAGASRAGDVRPRGHPVNASGDGYITSHSEPQCGRSKALALAERVRPILDRLYPEWRRENEPYAYFEFQSEHDASMRLLERLQSRAEIEQMLGDEDQSPRLAARRLHPLVWRGAAAQWATGHLHEAVLAAAKSVNSQLQKKLARRDLSDARLVRDAFSERPPAEGRPRLRFDAIEDEQTRTSMREGVMSFGAGCFMAIRNPVGHLPNDEHELTEQEALERLAALSLLARWIDQADVVGVEV